MNEFITADKFLDFFRDHRELLDVRSEIEFSEGHFPGSVNLPILNTEERAKVGTVYKKQGQEAAIRLGHELVSGKTKEDRISKWIEKLKTMNNPAITCFRGGMRSQIAQAWCREAGSSVPRIQGGTKALRNFLIQELETRTSKSSITVISGPTGAGKTLLLRDLTKHRLTLDLEMLAQHRGSAFGAYSAPQPSQILFENRISCEMIRFDQLNFKNKNILVEDESIMIGDCALPRPLFTKIRSAPLVYINENLETRTQTTFDDYIKESPIGRGDVENAHRLFDHYQNCTVRISKRLGGLRTSEILSDISEARRQFDSHRDLEANKTWIRKLLKWYYDPRYFKSFEERNVKYTFSGTRSEVFEYLLNPTKNNT